MFAEPVSSLLAGDHAKIDIVAPTNDEIILEIQNPGIGCGDPLAVARRVIVDAFQKQAVTQFGIGKNSRFASMHVGLEALEQFACGGFAAHRRQPRRGIVPYDVIVQAGDDGVDVLGLLNFDHLHQQGVAGSHKRALSSGRTRVDERLRGQAANRRLPPHTRDQKDAFNSRL